MIKSQPVTKKVFTWKISDGDVWMQMIQTRNQTSHTYDKEMAKEVVNEIVEQYFELFVTFHNEMKKLKEKEIGEI